MAKYTVKLKTPKGHVAPALLGELGEWLRTQPYGSVGWFELITEPIPSAWNPDAAERLSKAGFSFLHLPEGSMLALLKHDGKAPPAVVLLGSEGETATVALSLEELLFDLAKGDTQVADLDEEATGRGELGAWLKKHKVKVPETKPFDFDAWLEGGVKKPAPPAQPAGALSKELAALPPKLRALAALMGRRADDRDVVAYIKALGKKAPRNTTDADDTSYVVAPKHGLELLFSHDPPEDLRDKYPHVRVGRAYLPYLLCAWLRDDFGEKLPFGLTVGMPSSELPKLLGKPSRSIGQGTLKRPVWERILDADKGVVLAVEGWSGAKGAEVLLAVQGE